MEGYLKLKNGLDEINQLKQDLESMYNDQGGITSILENHAQNRGKRLENIPPLPNYERLDFVAKKTTEEGIILESLPCYEELNRGPEPSVNDKTSIAEVILFLAFGFWIFLTITQFFLYGIPSMELKTLEPGADSWTILELITWISTALTFPLYRYARRSISPVLKRRVSILELPGVVLIWFGVFGIMLGINDEVQGVVASNLVVGTLSISLGLGSFYSVKRSQRKKYFAEKEKLLQALNETARSKWISENSPTEAQRKRLEKSINELKREFLALSRDVKKYEEHIKKIETLDVEIDKATKQLNEKLTIISKIDDDITKIWTSIESMIPKSEMRSVDG